VVAGDGLFLSVGGGPTRPNRKLTNVNIAPFQNVDVVADAHFLPYFDATADGIYCEAVLEHLRHPADAVREMYRVMKPGARVIAITPFLQAFHGYPNHFQNYTIFGHAALFEDAGFRIEETGVCVGPMYTLFSLGASFMATYLPRIIGIPLRAAWGLLGAALRPLDLFVANRDSAYVMASTTYVLARKD
jgi:SAM-dependent methyltransferase